jgi:A/G-specific adenine glycosylase
LNANSRLLAWFQLNKRDLPFRKKKAAYEIWISEVMLQQTRVAAMLPLYENFLKKFPDVEALAISTEDSVVSAWQGLGYYSRARNIRKAAIYLQQNFNGRFPKELAEVLKIPGIGPYTARAILSIAYDIPLAVVDGNVKRVLSRFFLYADNIIGTKADKDFQKLADDFLNLSSPGDHNQAVMELGALICLPENPKCLTCPLLGDCQAQTNHKTDVIPVREKMREQISLKGKFLWIEQDSQVLLIRERNPRFLKGFFVLPMILEGVLPSEQYETSPTILKLYKSFAFEARIAKIKHTITHHKFEMQLFIHSSASNLNLNAEELHSAGIEYKWVQVSDLESEFPSSLAGKILKVRGIDR